MMEETEVAGMPWWSRDGTVLSLSKYLSRGHSRQCQTGSVENARVIPKGLNEMEMPVGSCRTGNGRPNLLHPPAA